MSMTKLTIEDMDQRVYDFTKRAEEAIRATEVAMTIDGGKDLVWAALASKVTADAWLMTREVCRRLDTLIEIDDLIDKGTRSKDE